MGDNTSFIRVGPAGRGAMTVLYEKDSCDDERSDSDFGIDEIIGWYEISRHRIAQIFIWHSDHEINSVQFQYAYVVNETGLDVSERHGISNGTKFDVVKLNWPIEYISWVRLHTTCDDILCSITFGTNCGEHGPFGEEMPGGEEFNFRLGVGNQFGGFFGFYNQSMMTGFGVYLKVVPPIV